MKYIDLNSDVGEGLGPFRNEREDQMMKLITSANIACGFHSGDPRLMLRTVRLAKHYGVTVGAHVGFPDLPGFGRRRILATMEEVRTDVLYQLGALSAFCRVEGVELKHVKPHGGMYYLAVEDKRYAQALVEAVYEFDRHLVLFVPPGSYVEEAALDKGLRIAREIFADRAYTREGRLVPRNVEGAVIADPEKVAARVLRVLVDGRVECVTGEEIEMSGDTVCVHSDTPDAERIAAVLRRELETAGFEIRASN